MFIAELFLDEISDELRRSYLDRAGKHVDRRMDHMARVRDRLNKGYEIYHADRPAGPTQIVDRFEANTPREAQQYYEKFIQNYESDVDFDLRLRRSTGIMEYVEQLPALINKTADVDGIQVSINTNDKNATAYASANGKRLGYAEFDRDSNTLIPYDLAVDDRYRGQGIAAIIYDYVKSLGFRIEASPDQTPDGKYFWKKNRGSKRVWETKLDEVTTVPTVAKSKRAHLDVMPNDGRPIPQGEEEHYLGNKIGQLGNVEVWQYNQGPVRTFVVFDPKKRISQLAVTGSSYRDNPNSLIIKGVYSGPKNETRAANLYAWLIAQQGLTLVSDIKQSEGGYRVWQDLERRFGRYVNIHGFDTKTNKAVNVTAKDEPDTHVGQEHLPAIRDIQNIATNVRLVASPK
jgi:GNAT superfamily N-acetyltransferase